MVFSCLTFYVNPESHYILFFYGAWIPFCIIYEYDYSLYIGYLKEINISLFLYCIAGSSYHTSRFVQLTFWSSGVPENALSLKIMSYNVRLFDLYNWTKNEKTRDQILTFLKEEDADVICFQEYYYYLRKSA